MVGAGDTIVSPLRENGFLEDAKLARNQLEPSCMQPRVSQPRVSIAAIPNPENEDDIIECANPESLGASAAQVLLGTGTDNLIDERTDDGDNGGSYYLDGLSYEEHIAEYGYCQAHFRGKWVRGVLVRYSLATLQILVKLSRAKDTNKQR